MDPPSCTTEGVCSEEAEGFSCLCNDGFGGATCGIVQNFLLSLFGPKCCGKNNILASEFLEFDGESVIDREFDPLLGIDSTQQFMDLRTRVIDGVRSASCIIDHKFSIYIAVHDLIETSNEFS